MADPGLVTKAALMTGTLFLASLVTRAAQAPDASCLTAAADLALRAMQWRETAVQDTNAAMRLQHISAAAAYMQAARSLANDGDLERLVGFDVARANRSLERRVSEARQNLNSVLPSRSAS